MHKQDAAAAADFYTLNGLKVLDWTVGTLSGRDAIEKDFAAYFASGPLEVVGKPVQMYAVGTPDELTHADSRFRQTRRSRATSAARLSTLIIIRFQPPGSGLRPSGIFGRFTLLGQIS